MTIGKAADMGTREILEQALNLKPEERFIVVEGLLHSLDESDPTIDAVWADEAERRLQAYREGRLAGIPLEDVFKSNS